MKPIVFLPGGKDCVTLLSDVGVVGVDVWLVGIWAQLPDRDCRGLEVGEQFGFVQTFTLGESVPGICNTTFAFHESTPLGLEITTEPPHQ